MFHFLYSQKGYLEFVIIEHKQNWNLHFFVSLFWGRRTAYSSPKRSWKLRYALKCFSRMIKSTYSNTEESFWSPQIKISAMDRKVSTNSPLLCSDTVWFLDKTLYKYFRCSNEWRFFGRPQPPPNQLLLRNMLHFHTLPLEW